jgi:hypothetical protein
VQYRQLDLKLLRRLAPRQAAVQQVPLVDRNPQDWHKVLVPQVQPARSLRQVSARLQAQVLLSVFRSGGRLHRRAGSVRQVQLVFRPR